MVLQSLVPSWSDDEARDHFARAVGPDKATRLVDLLTDRPDRDRLFDVQYQPLGRTTRGYLVGLNIFATSNLLRNTRQRNRRRPHLAGGNDPLVAVARGALRSRAECVHPTDLK